MRTFTGLLFAPILAVLLSSCKPSEKAVAEKAAADTELKSLEGKWKVASREGATSEEDDGSEKLEPELTYYFVIDKDILREEYKDRNGKVEVLSRRRMTINPGASPKTVDLVWVDEAGKEIKERVTKKGITGKKKVSTTVLKDVAIYKIDGNKLDFCISWDEKNRPTDFSAPPKSSRYLVKLEKVEEKDAAGKTAPTPTTK